MISVRFQGKPFNITVIQVYAPTSNAEEAEVERFSEDLQDLLELTSKKDVLFIIGAAAAAKSLQSCLTLCNPIDGSPPGSPIPGILQARTLEWVVISFSFFIVLNMLYTGEVSMCSLVVGWKFLISKALNLLFLSVLFSCMVTYVGRFACLLIQP